MPRQAIKGPILYLALSPAGAAAALGIRADEVKKAVAEGKLISRRIGIKHRIAVFGPGGIQEWFESWPRAKQRKQRKIPHG